MSKNTQTNGTVPVGDALLGRAIDAAGQPIDGGEPLTGLRRLPIERPAGTEQAAPLHEMLQTGIKVIDLFAPIVRGGTIPMIAVPGVGMIVSSTELIHNIATHHHGCAVIAELENQIFSTKELLAELSSAGVNRHTALVMGQHDDAPDVKRQIALMSLTLAEHFCEQGRETLLFLDEHLLSPQIVERLRRRQHSAQAAITLFVWHVKRPETFDPHSILSQSPLEPDGQLVFSQALAKQSIWPAVDPLASGSRLLSQQHVSAEHVRVAHAARELLAGYSDLAEGGAGDDSVLQARARKALLFQMQPFVVAEPFTGRPGEYVPLEETLRGFDEIVAGLHDSLPDEAFRFSGTLGQVLARVKR
jgi:F-type H+-transporting ATPase subunit beta